MKRYSVPEASSRRVGDTIIETIRYRDSHGRIRTKVVYIHLK